MAPPNDRRRSESGNVFAIVMIGVVLFGALMYTFSRGAKQGTGNLTRKRTEVVASDIISYAQRLERGVVRVMSNSCSENFISFETPGIDSYPVNPDAPTDFSCHVFNPAGGGLSPVQAQSFGITDLNIRPSGGTALSDVGTGAQDLVVWFEDIPAELCQELNKRMNHSGTIPVIADSEAWEFGATPTPNQHWGATTTALGTLSGFTGGCINRNAAPSNAQYLAQGYSFFYVLYPR